MTALTTVLVVDDDQNNLKLLRLDLEDAGHPGCTVPSGIQALEILKSAPQDIGVVVFDRQMPGLNGLEVVALMKGNPQLARIPVIMQTGATVAERVVEGMQAGVSVYPLIQAAARDAADVDALHRSPHVPVHA